MFSNNNKNRKCSQKCDVTATLLVFQKNGTAAVLVTTPVDGGRVSHNTCGWRPCSSRHLWMAAVLVTTPLDGGRVSHDTFGSCGVALFFCSNKFA